MAQRSISKPTAAAVVYPSNHRASVDQYTIQNLTDAVLVVKVTAGAIQREAVVFSDPAAGAISLAVNAIGNVSQPVTAFEFSGTGVGKVNVVEQF